MQEYSCKYTLRVCAHHDNVYCLLQVEFKCLKLCLSRRCSDHIVSHPVSHSQLLITSRSSADPTMCNTSVLTETAAKTLIQL